MSSLLNVVGAHLRLFSFIQSFSRTFYYFFSGSSTFQTDLRATPDLARAVALLRSLALAQQDEIDGPLTCEQIRDFTKIADAEVIALATHESCSVPLNDAGGNARSMDDVLFDVWGVRCTPVTTSSWSFSDANSFFEGIAASDLGPPFLVPPAILPPAIPIEVPIDAVQLAANALDNVAPGPRVAASSGVCADTMSVARLLLDAIHSNIGSGIQSAALTEARRLMLHATDLVRNQVHVDALPVVLFPPIQNCVESANSDDAEVCVHVYVAIASQRFNT
jgi:hypothetical protein